MIAFGIWLGDLWSWQDPLLLVLGLLGALAVGARWAEIKGGQQHGRMDDPRA